MKKLSLATLYKKLLNAPKNNKSEVIDAINGSGMTYSEINELYDKISSSRNLEGGRKAELILIIAENCPNGRLKYLEYIDVMNKLTSSQNTFKMFERIIKAVQPSEFNNCFATFVYRIASQLEIEEMEPSSETFKPFMEYMTLLNISILTNLSNLHGYYHYIARGSSSNTFSGRLARVRKLFLMALDNQFQKNNNLADDGLKYLLDQLDTAKMESLCMAISEWCPNIPEDMCIYIHEHIEKKFNQSLYFKCMFFLVNLPNMPNNIKQNLYVVTGDLKYLGQDVIEAIDSIF